MVLASMTGFGRARGDLSRRFSASVVIRSVNHKFLDVQVRTNLREETPELEATVRTAVSSAVQRGRVTAQVNLERTLAQDTTAMVDVQALSSIVEELRRMESVGGRESSVRLRDVLSIPGLVTVTARETQLDEAEIASLEAVVGEAVERFVRMREEEARGLEGQLSEELGRVEEFLDELEPQLDEIRGKILERLRDRMEKLLGTDSQVEPERLIQEAAIVADRGDVSEEMTRLRTHLRTFRDRLEKGGAVGRTLDFLCQEIHRELNTLGSKCREVGVAEKLVEAKAAGERLREQVQNLE